MRWLEATVQTEKNMNTKTKLETLAQYYATTRQAGHTTAMIKGAVNTERCVILAPNHHTGEMLQKLAPAAKIVSLENPELRGMRLPMLVDNSTMSRILSLALCEIERLEKALATAKASNGDVSDCGRKP